MPCLAVMLKMNKRQGNYQRKWDTESCKEFIEENNIDVELLSEYNIDYILNSYFGVNKEVVQ